MNGIFKVMVIAAGMATLALPGSAAAYYSPALGRFVQRDPLGYVDGMNLYEYVKSQPVQQRDLSGRGILDDLALFWDWLFPATGQAPYDPSAKCPPEEADEGPPYQPLPGSSPQCDEYPDNYKYSGANAKCFCKNAGDSPWAQLVRGCLKTNYDRGMGANASHITCYRDADAKYPRPTATLAAAYAKCR